MYLPWAQGALENWYSQISIIQHQNSLEAARESLFIPGPTLMFLPCPQHTLHFSHKSVPCRKSCTKPPVWSILLPSSVWWLLLMHQGTEQMASGSLRRCPWNPSRAGSLPPSPIVFWPLISLYSGDTLHLALHIMLPGFFVSSPWPWAPPGWGWCPNHLWVPRTCHVADM